MKAKVLVCLLIVPTMCMVAAPIQMPEAKVLQQSVDPLGKNDVMEMVIASLADKQFQHPIAAVAAVDLAMADLLESLRESRPEPVLKDIKFQLQKMKPHLLQVLLKDQPDFLELLRERGIDV